MKNRLADLIAKGGVYQGSGTNHEGQSFIGSLALTPCAKGRGLSLDFVATGLSGETFHTEHSLIGPTLDDGIAIWILSSNHPGVTEHRLTDEEQSRKSETEECRTLVFRCGDMTNVKTFREEVYLDLWTNGDVGYRYAWGMPGGKFEDRSGACMRLVATMPDPTR